MNIAVVGASRVGLINASVLSIQGHDVVCVDDDIETIARLQNGESPFKDHGIQNLLDAGSNQGSIYFSCDRVSVIADADVVFLTLESSGLNQGEQNQSDLIRIGEEIASSLKQNAIVVISSTFPVGTCAMLRETMQAFCSHEIEVAVCPDFFRIGHSINDALTPDRIVIGTDSRQVAKILSSLFEPIVAATRHRCPLIIMSPESAELTKLAASCLMALKVSFINEIANLCDHVGADIESVRHGMCTDRRIGWDFFRPCAGLGGPTLKSDMRNLVSLAEDLDFNPRLLIAAAQANADHEESISTRILEYFDHDLSGKRIAIWGLAYTPETDDVRFSPSIKLIRRLLEVGADLIAHDPQAIENSRKLLGHSIAYSEDKYSIMRGADALVVMTAWPEYLAVDPSVLCRDMRNPFVFDAQNCLNRDSFAWNNCDYYSIGQKPLLRRLKNTEANVFNDKGERHSRKILRVCRSL